MNQLKRTFAEFGKDECTTRAAGLAYYTVFALPPLLYLLLTILTWALYLAYEPGQAEKKAESLIQTYSADLVGNEAAADEISTMLKGNQAAGGVWWKSLISIAAILFGATGVVAALQSSLNQVWNVQPDPEAGGVWSFLSKRLLSFGMIIGLGFLLLVSMVLSAVMTAAGSQVGQWLGFEEPLVKSINYAVMFLLTFVIFAVMFRFMPDAKVTWKVVFIGAIVTAVLFSLGRFGLGVYLANSSPGAQLGSAAASLAVLLVWVYYSAMIVLFGAEFTQVWSAEYGRGVQPEPGAVRVERKVVRNDQPESAEV